MKPNSKNFTPIFFACLIAACGTGRIAASSPTASEATPLPDMTKMPTPTMITPSRTPPPIMTQTPIATDTFELFNQDVFNVEELTDNLELQIELDPGGNSLPVGIYMLYLQNMITRDEKGNVSFELWYISMDGRQHGRILSMRGNVNLISVTRDPLDRRLMLAHLSEDLVKTWRVDWGAATVKGYVAQGIRGLFKEPRYSSLDVSPQSAYAFSPDGRWLVWDCEPEGVSAYCLIDLEGGGGIAVYPEGYNIEQNRMLGFYTWSPDGDWFLADCHSLINPDWGAQCLVWPELGVIERWEYKLWVASGSFSPFFFIRRHSISPDGEHLFIVQVLKGDEGKNVGYLLVLDEACLLSEKCEAKFLLQFPPSIENWEAVWSFSGDQLAVSYSPLISSSSYDPGLTTIVVVNVADGSSRVVADGVYNGADVIGWSPDGEWIAMNCGDRHPYAVCTLSIDGFFRPLVLDHEGSRQEFLGWLVVP